MNSTRLLAFLYSASRVSTLTAWLYAQSTPLHTTVPPNA